LSQVTNALDSPKFILLDEIIDTHGYYMLSMLGPNKCCWILYLIPSHIW